MFANNIRVDIFGFWLKSDLNNKHSAQIYLWDWYLYRRQCHM